jgi:hypothetical protein
MRRESISNDLSSIKNKLNKEKGSKSSFFNGHASIEEAREKPRFGTELRRYRLSSNNVFFTEWQINQ